MSDGDQKVRRAGSRSTAVRRRVAWRPLLWVIGALLLLVLVAVACHRSPNLIRSTDPVAFSRRDHVVLPVSQILSPAGAQVELPGLRPQALALSPDGRVLLTAGKTPEIIVIDPDTAAVRQRVPLPAAGQDVPADAVSTHFLQPDEEGQLSYTGLVFSPDGGRAYMSDVNGSVKVFRVSEPGSLEPLRSLPLPATGLERRGEPIPSGLRVSEDGKRLFVVLNLTNRLVELDAASGRILRRFEVGVAPFDVILADGKAYVSNWGGRRPEADSVVGPAGRGSEVRVDPKRYVASDGSVTAIDLEAGRVVREIPVGLHSSGLALTPDRRFLAVANAASDSVSVIDTRRDEVVETISLRWQPRDYFGASPNALTFDSTGRKLFVCNGTQNAVAVVSFDPGHSTLEGMIPVGWFPGAILYDGARNALVVANIKGLGSGRRTFGPEEEGFNSRQYFGSISVVPVPDDRQLVRYTKTVRRTSDGRSIEAAQLPARPGRAARPVPERVGEPSVFKHVVYIIKENRTYDQVLGDLARGNGDPRLCVFGERVTPNLHKIVKEFVLSGQHLLFGDPECRRASVVDDRNGNRLYGEVVCRIPSKLSGRDERRRRRCAGLCADRIHLGQRSGAGEDASRLR